MCKKLILLVSVVLALGLVSGAKGDVIESFETGVDSWVLTDTAETLAQSTEGVTDGTSSMQRNFVSGWHEVDLDISGFVDVLNANDTLEIDVTTSLTAEQVGWYLEQMIILQGGNAAGSYYLEGPLVSIASPDGTPTTTTVAFNYGPALADGPLTDWAKIRLVNNTGGDGVLYYDNLRAVSSAPPPAVATVVIGDFESDLDGWWLAGDDFTLSLSTTGATRGTQALQVDGTGNWRDAVRLDLKPHRATLAKPGATITVDITAFDADMTTTWMQIDMVINAQNNDDSGANNNVGWHALGSQDIVRDGQPHTHTWVLPESLTSAIAGVDDNISWFELNLVSNLDGASVAKFYIDNVQLSYEAPEAPPTATIIGDWENDMDGWEIVGGAPAGSATEFSTEGVTLGAQSLKLTIPEGNWKDAMMFNINAQGLNQVFQDNREFSIDVTRLVADWSGEPNSGYSELVFTVNAGGDGWSIWNQTSTIGWWKWDQGDQTQTVTFDYSSSLPQIQFDNIWWLELWITSNYDPAYTSGGVYYLDNAQLSGAQVADTGKSTDTIIGNWEQDMDGWVAGGNADVVFNDHNGVTLDNYSLDVWHAASDWQELLTLDLMGQGLVEAFAINQQISVDVTRLVADWPTDTAPDWGAFHMAINAGGDGWELWENLGYEGNWVPGDGDQTTAVVWSYADYLNQMDLNNVTWAELIFISNYDPGYTGGVLFYLDNMKLSGAGVPLDPQPADGATDVPIDTTLNWTAGTFAASHHLYFGTDLIKVSDADMDSDPNVVFAELDVANFDPNGLEFKTKYFWRVDEVNEANPDSPWNGPVWNFTTANFIVVDDFESYNDIDPPDPESHTIFAAWADGYGIPTNGALVGHAYPPYAEQVTIRNGIQSMPLYYDNTGEALQSEVERVWNEPNEPNEPQDWTTNGFNALKLYTYGNTLNTPGELYVIIEDSAGLFAKVVDPNTAIFTTEEWTEWEISLDDIAAAGVNLTAVTKLVIGVADQAGQAEANGLFYIDDIRIGFVPIGLVAYYAFENNIEDSSGNGHHGTLAGDPNFPVAYVNGPAGFGQAMLFDGSLGVDEDQGIDTGHQHVDLGTFNPSAATDQLSIALWAKWDGPSEFWQAFIGKRQSGDWDREIMMWYFELERDAWDIRFDREGSSVNTVQTLEVGQWTHVAVTFDGTTAKVYFNGVVVQEGDFSFGNDTEAPMQIGAATGGGGNPFNGALDEVRLYDIVLSEAEILQLAGK